MSTVPAPRCRFSVGNFHFYFRSFRSLTFLILGNFELEMCEGFKLDGLLVADATLGCAPEHSHEVLGDDFEPIDRRLALENLVVVIPAQTDAMSESLHAHVRVYSLI